MYEFKIYAHKNRYKFLAAVISVLLLSIIFTNTLAAEVTPATETASGALDLKNMLNQLPPEVSFVVLTLGFGGIAGWCVGFTLKKIAKILALLIGTVFISIQYLAYNKYIVVDWNKIEQTVPPAQVETFWQSIMSALTCNLPFGGAFIAGLLLGLRKG